MFKPDNRNIDEIVNEICQCEECMNLFIKEYAVHTSDCSVHNEPAERNEECDCERPHLTKVNGIQGWQS